MFLHHGLKQRKKEQVQHIFKATVAAETNNFSMKYVRSHHISSAIWKETIFSCVKKIFSRHHSQNGKACEDGSRLKDKRSSETKDTTFRPIVVKRVLYIPSPADGTTTHQHRTLHQRAHQFEDTNLKTVGINECPHSNTSKSQEERASVGSTPRQSISNLVVYDYRQVESAANSGNDDSLTDPTNKHSSTLGNVTAPTANATASSKFVIERGHLEDAYVDEDGNAGSINSDGTSKEDTPEGVTNGCVIVDVHRQMISEAKEHEYIDTNVVRETFDHETSFKLKMPGRYPSASTVSSHREI